MQEWCGCQIRYAVGLGSPIRNHIERPNENLNFPLFKGILHQRHRCLIDSWFHFSVGRRKVEMGRQHRLSVPVRTNVPFDISSVTSQPFPSTKLFKLLQPANSKRQTARPPFSSHLGPNGYSTRRCLQLRSTVTVGIPPFETGWRPLLLYFVLSLHFRDGFATVKGESAGVQYYHGRAF